MKWLAVVKMVRILTYNKNKMKKVEQCIVKCDNYEQTNAVISHINGVNTTADKYYPYVIVYGKTYTLWPEVNGVWDNLVIVFDEWVKTFGKRINNSGDGGWINLKDSQPQFKVLVLTIDKDGDIRILVLYRKEEDINGCNYFFEDEFGDDLYTTITHWMPLPNPPVNKAS